MVSFESSIRTRYCETDQMGYVHHGNYAKYYEIGRTDLMREIGFAYDRLEKSGIIMPVISMNCRFIAPAFYDELLTVKTIVKEIPVTRATFYYEIYNKEQKMINKGDTVLVFVDKTKRKPVRIPDALFRSVKVFFLE